MTIEELAARIDGAAWAVEVIYQSKRGHGGPDHGSPRRWDWGRTLRSLAEAQMRRERMARFAANLTPDERDAVWSDPSREAAALRRAMR